MKSLNKIIAGLIVALILAFLNLVLVIKTYGQDSVRLKITKVKGNVYWLKGKGVRYKTVCTCSKRKKGEVVVIANKDLIIIKEEK